MGWTYSVSVCLPISVKVRECSDMQWRVVPAVGHVLTLLSSNHSRTVTPRSVSQMQLHSSEKLFSQFKIWVMQAHMVTAPCVTYALSTKRQSSASLSQLSGPGIQLHATQLSVGSGCSYIIAPWSIKFYTDPSDEPRVKCSRGRTYV
jgi:hypothetical protein